MFDAYIVATLTNFHFLRPYWLLLLVPAFFFIWILIQKKPRASAWNNVIDAQLLNSMLNNSKSQPKAKNAWPYWLAAWIIATIALAGPAVKKLPQPISKNQHALIILLDMSASMAAQDIKPSRATRATQKITDIVRERRDGLTALIAYAGDAYTVTPLTDDTHTIQTLLPALSPFIMPSAGSRPDKAVALAKQLVADAGLQSADLLLITDGVITKDGQRVANELRPGLKLNTIAIATDEGAPIPLPNGGFLRDGSGKIIVPSFSKEALNHLASSTNGRWIPISLDDSDWLSLISDASLNNPQATDHKNEQRQFDNWRDDGFWLILLLLPFSLLLFRKGVFAFIPLLLILPLSEPAQANTLTRTWNNAWQTPDQQGFDRYTENPSEAAELFNNGEWKAASYYEASDYENAIKAYQDATPTSINQYNLGNSLAKNGQLEEAIKAYNSALQKQPDFPQAQKNKSLVEEQLKKQKQQNKDQKKSDNQEKSNKNGSGNPETNQQDGSKSDDKNSNSDNENQNSPNKNSQENENNESNNNQNKGHEQHQENKKSSSNNENQSEASNKKTDSKTENEPNSTNQDASYSNQDEQEAYSTQEGLSREEQAAMDKWLQRVPDNPGNLLQRKFLYQYRQQESKAGEQGDVLW